MRVLLFLTAVLLLAAPLAPAQAIEETVAAFGQPTGAANGFALTPNAGDTASTLSMVNVPVDFTAFLGGIPGIGDMSLTANSVTPAASLLGQLGQRFSGSFCITSGPGCSGTNFISGTFSDAAFGTAGGVDLTVNVSDPTESLALTSDVVPASELQTPSAFALSLVTGSDALALLGSGSTQTLGGAAGGAIDYFATGDVSASTPIAEPVSTALLAVGLIGLGMVRYRRRGPMHE